MLLFENMTKIVLVAILLAVSLTVASAGKCVDKSFYHLTANILVHGLFNETDVAGTTGNKSLEANQTVGEANQTVANQTGSSMLLGCIYGNNTSLNSECPAACKGRALTRRCSSK